MSMTETEVKIVSETNPTPASVAGQTGQAEQDKPKKGPRPNKKTRSQKYQAVRSQVDKTRLYDAFSAIELIKKLSYSSFPGTVVAHVVLGEKFVGERFELQLPHSTGRNIRVAIADDKLLAAVADGKIDFDILLATPDMMPKLAKIARILGPRGLMPNPKQGTLTNKPEVKKKELEAGKMTIKTERKAPLMHVVIGNTDLETKALVENLQALTAVLKGKLEKLSLAATMSPGIKVAVEK